MFEGEGRGEFVAGEEGRRCKEEIRSNVEQLPRFEVIMMMMR